MAISSSGTAQTTISPNNSPRPPTVMMAASTVNTAAAAVASPTGSHSGTSKYSSLKVDTARAASTPTAVHDGQAGPNWVAVKKAPNNRIPPMTAIAAAATAAETSNVAPLSRGALTCWRAATQW